MAPVGPQTPGGKHNVVFAKPPKGWEEVYSLPRNPPQGGPESVQSHTRGAPKEGMFKIGRWKKPKDVLKPGGTHNHKRPGLTGPLPRGF